MEKITSLKIFHLENNYPSNNSKLWNSIVTSSMMYWNKTQKQCNAMQSVHCCVRKKSNFWMELENEKEGARSMRWDEMGGDALICSSRFDICPSHDSSHPHSLSLLPFFLFLLIFFLSNTSVYLFIYLSVSLHSLSFLLLF